jgi:hypothetical protein
VLLGAVFNQQQVCNNNLSAILSSFWAQKIGTRSVDYFSHNFYFMGIKQNDLIKNLLLFAKSLKTIIAVLVDNQYCCAANV